VRIVVASDHAGFPAKAEVIAHCRARGHEVEDLGPADASRVDYPDYADRVASRIVDGTADRGVLICGSGIGMSIAANRHRGVRAVVALAGIQAALARAHNDANVLCLGARLSGPAVIEEMLEAFLDGTFEGGRHGDRVRKLG